jgi:hypothetical protein
VSLARQNERAARSADIVRTGTVHVNHARSTPTRRDLQSSRAGRRCVDLCVPTSSGAGSVRGSTQTKARPFRFAGSDPLSTSCPGARVTDDGTSSTECASSPLRGIGDTR